MKKGPKKNSSCSIITIVPNKLTQEIKTLQKNFHSLSNEESLKNFKALAKQNDFYPTLITILNKDDKNYIHRATVKKKAKKEYFLECAKQTQFRQFCVDQTPENTSYSYQLLYIFYFNLLPDFSNLLNFIGSLEQQEKKSLQAQVKEFYTFLNQYKDKVAVLFSNSLKKSPDTFAASIREKLIYWIIIYATANGDYAVYLLKSGLRDKAWEAYRQGLEHLAHYDKNLLCLLQDSDLSTEERIKLQFQYENQSRTVKQGWTLLEQEFAEHTKNLPVSQEMVITSIQLDALVNDVTQRSALLSPSASNEMVTKVIEACPPILKQVIMLAIVIERLLTKNTKQVIITEPENDFSEVAWQNLAFKLNPRINTLYFVYEHLLPSIALRKEDYPRLRHALWENLHITMVTSCDWYTSSFLEAGYCYSFYQAITEYYALIQKYLPSYVNEASEQDRIAKSIIAYSNFLFVHQQVKEAQACLRDNVASFTHLSEELSKTVKEKLEFYDKQKQLPKLAALAYQLSLQHIFQEFRRVFSDLSVTKENAISLILDEIQIKELTRKIKSVTQAYDFLAERLIFTSEREISDTLQVVKQCSETDFLSPHLTLLIEFSQAWQDFFTVALQDTVTKLILDLVCKFKNSLLTYQAQLNPSDLTAPPLRETNALLENAISFSSAKEMAAALIEKALHIPASVERSLAVENCLQRYQGALKQTSFISNIYMTYIGYLAASEELAYPGDKAPNDENFNALLKRINLGFFLYYHLFADFRSENAVFMETKLEILHYLWAEIVQLSVLLQLSIAQKTTESLLKAFEYLTIFPEIFQDYRRLLLQIVNNQRGYLSKKQLIDFHKRSWDVAISFIVAPLNFSFIESRRQHNQQAQTYAQIADQQLNYLKANYFKLLESADIKIEEAAEDILKHLLHFKKLKNILSAAPILQTLLSRIQSIIQAVSSHQSSDDISIIIEDDFSAKIEALSKEVQAATLNEKLSQKFDSLPDANFQLTEELIQKFVKLPFDDKSHQILGCLIRLLFAWGNFFKVNNAIPLCQDLEQGFKRLIANLTRIQNDKKRKKHEALLPTIFDTLIEKAITLKADTNETDYTELVKLITPFYKESYFFTHLFAHIFNHPLYKETSNEACFAALNGQYKRVDQRINLWHFLLATVFPAGSDNAAQALYFIANNLYWTLTNTASTLKNALIPNAALRNYFEDSERYYRLVEKYFPLYRGILDNACSKTNNLFNAGTLKLLKENFFVNYKTLVAVHTTYATIKHAKGEQSTAARLLNKTCVDFFSLRNKPLFEAELNSMQIEVIKALNNQLVEAAFDIYQPCLPKKTRLFFKQAETIESLSNEGKAQIAQLNIFLANDDNRRLLHTALDTYINFPPSNFPRLNNISIENKWLFSRIKVLCFFIDQVLIPHHKPTPIFDRALNRLLEHIKVAFSNANMLYNNAQESEYQTQMELCKKLTVHYSNLNVPKETKGDHNHKNSKKPTKPADQTKASTPEKIIPPEKQKITLDTYISPNWVAQNTQLKQTTITAANNWFDVTKANKEKPPAPQKMSKSNGVSPSIASTTDKGKTHSRSIRRKKLLSPTHKTNTPLEPQKANISLNEKLNNGPEKNDTHQQRQYTTLSDYLPLANARIADRIGSKVGEKTFADILKSTLNITEITQGIVDLTLSPEEPQAEILAPSNVSSEIEKTQLSLGLSNDYSAYKALLRNTLNVKESCKLKLSDSIWEIYWILVNRGFATYFCGGVVRDTLLDLPIHDIDMCTTCPREHLHEILKEKNGKFGKRPNLYHLHHLKLDITSTISPDLITEAKDRDLTINTFFATHEGIFDPLEKFADLNSPFLHLLGDVDKRLEQFPNLILRLVRFSNWVNKKLSDEYLLFMRKHAYRLTSLEGGVLISNIKALFLRNTAQAQANLASLINNKLIAYLIMKIEDRNNEQLEYFPQEADLNNLLYVYCQEQLAMLNQQTDKTLDWRPIVGLLLFIPVMTEISDNIVATVARVSALLAPCFLDDVPYKRQSDYMEGLKEVIKKYVDDYFYLQQLTSIKFLENPALLSPWPDCYLTSPPATFTPSIHVTNGARKLQEERNSNHTNGHTFPQHIVHKPAGSQ